jgi:hypothetical protein
MQIFCSQILISWTTEPLRLTADLQVLWLAIPDALINPPVKNESHFNQGHHQSICITGIWSGTMSES